MTDDTRPDSPDNGRKPEPEPDRFRKGLGMASGGPAFALWGSVVLGAILVLSVVFGF